MNPSPNRYKAKRMFREMPKYMNFGRILNYMFIVLLWNRGIECALYALLRTRKDFEFRGRKIPYFIHPYNQTYQNERCVEVALAKDFLSGELNNQTLEVGNVLSHYGLVGHTVIDKYERHQRVLNEDVLSFRPQQRFLRIVSISTIEHVGWDDEPQKSDGPIQAIRSMYDLLADGGEALITAPIGYNPHLDSLVGTEAIGLISDSWQQYVFRRQARWTHWEETSANAIQGIGYGMPYPAANALWVCFIKKPQKMP